MLPMTSSMHDTGLAVSGVHQSVCSEMAGCCAPLGSDTLAGLSQTQGVAHHHTLSFHHGYLQDHSSLTPPCPQLMSLSYHQGPSTTASHFDVSTDSVAVPSVVCRQSFLPSSFGHHVCQSSRNAVSSHRSTDQLKTFAGLSSPAPLPAVMLHGLPADNRTGSSHVLSCGDDATRLPSNRFVPYVGCLPTNHGRCRFQNSASSSLLVNGQPEYVDAAFPTWRGTSLLDVGVCANGSVQYPPVAVQNVHPGSPFVAPNPFLNQNLSAVGTGSLPGHRSMLVFPVCWMSACI